MSPQMEVFKAASEASLAAAIALAKDTIEGRSAVSADDVRKVFVELRATVPVHSFETKVTEALNAFNVARANQTATALNDAFAAIGLAISVLGPLADTAKAAAESLPLGKLADGLEVLSPIFTSIQSALKDLSDADDDDKPKKALDVVKALKAAKEKIDAFEKDEDENEQE